MTVKRTRTSNDAELEPFPAAKSPPNPTAVQLPSKMVTPPPPVPVITDTTNQSKLGGFLERCQYCRKRIPEGVEVFMYKDFCAFCSAGCREIQISLDKLAERQAACYTERVIQYPEMKDVKSHCGS